MKRLLITGVSGLLGINLALISSDPGRAAGVYDVIGLVHSHPLIRTPFEVRKVDLSRLEAVKQVLDECQPELLINCAAITDIDAVESKPGIERGLNAELPGLLAIECVQRGIRFLHISTDAVFDGEKGWYTEEDVPNPTNFYSQSKLAGEKAVMAVNPQAVIARVNFFGWSMTGKRSLAEWYLTNLAANQPVMGFTDILFCPLLVTSLAEILLQILEKHLVGLYHIVSRDWISKYDFGITLAHQFGLDDRLIQPVSYKEAGLFALRSPNLILNTTKLTRDLGFPPPDIRSGVRQFFNLLEQGYPLKLHSFMDDQGSMVKTTLTTLN
jgi:dTDP-4-dehydrorhamnose reductase